MVWVLPWLTRGSQTAGTGTKTCAPARTPTGSAGSTARRRKCLSVPGEQLAWNEYCDDTGHHPSDIVQRTKTGVPVVRGVQLFAKFEEHGPLVRYTASWYEVLGKKEDDK